MQFDPAMMHRRFIAPKNSRYAGELCRVTGYNTRTGSLRYSHQPCRSGRFSGEFLPAEDVVRFVNENKGPQFPEVAKFGELMLKELRANAAKGHWRDSGCTPEEMLKDIGYHFKKLAESMGFATTVVVNDGVLADPTYDDDSVFRTTEYATDIANECMMLLDLQKAL